MSDLSLTPEQIYEITGKVQPAAQLRELRRMGIRAHRSDNPDRPVMVLHAWLADEPKTTAQSEPRIKSDRRPSS